MPGTSHLPSTPRTILILLLSCATSFSCSGLAAPQTGVPQASHTKISSSDQAQLHAALDAYDQGKASQAEPLLRQLVSKYPSNYEANEALGSLYAEAGAAAKALPYLQRSCILAPHQALAHANLGATYLKLSRGPQALHELQLAAQLDPQNAPAQSNLGQAFMLEHQPKAAAEAFARAAALAPDDTELRYNQALALYESGASDQAASLLARTPAAAMTVPMHSLAADANERSGHFAEALENFQAAARIDPTDRNLYALTTELLRHWNWTEAIDVARFASTRFPESPHFKVAAGIALYARSDYKAATSLFAGLLQADPNDAVVADLLGRSCSALPDGQDPDCTAIFDFAQRHPANATMNTYAAVALLHAAYDRQNLDKAASLLHAAIAADPNDAEAFLRMGMLEQTRLHWAESATVLERSIALRPEAPEAHYRLSRAYDHLGRHNEAQAQIALHQAYAKQAKDSLDTRMKEVMRFVLNPS